MSSFIFIKYSDILYGYYNTKTMDSVFLERIKGLINKAKEARASLADNYIPEVIHSITWKDIKATPNSKEV
jgi:hypothetical protein